MNVGLLGSREKPRYNQNIYWWVWHHLHSAKIYLLEIKYHEGKYFCLIFYSYNYYGNYNNTWNNKKKSVK